MAKKAAKKKAAKKVAKKKISKKKGSGPTFGKGMTASS